MEKFKLYDVVALLKQIPNTKLSMGQVGTIVHVYTDEDVEVEFSRPNGAIIELLTLKTDDILLLHYEAEVA